jgi:DNA-damage-inducible protein J
MLHVRIDDATKQEATAALEAVGLSVSDAVRLFLKRVVAERGFPLELKVPNAETRAALEESRELIKLGKGRLLTPEELFDELDKATGR